MEATPEEQLVARWIEPNPQRAGVAEAWVLPGCVSAWVIIGQLKLEYWKAEVVAGEYELPLEAINAAIAYYHRHQDAIDTRIAESRAFFRA